MGIAADAIRPYWMPGIHNVNGILDADFDFRSWVNRKEYQVHSPIAADSFRLTVSDNRPLCDAFAADISRLASAALETLHDIGGSVTSPKARAWLFIRSYYAAYYASNAICRIVGTTASQFETEHARSVYKVADLFGNAAVPAVQGGFYECTFESNNKSIRCRKMAAAAGGHEQFWACFLALVRRISSAVLQGGSIHAQAVAAKLFELDVNLRLEGRNGGNWLSYVRNEVTYRHGLGAWFPYRSGIRWDAISANLVKWRHDPMGIDIASFRDPSPDRFVMTCVFLVSLCNELLEDVATLPRRSFVHCPIRSWCANLK